MAKKRVKLREIRLAGIIGLIVGSLMLMDGDRSGLLFFGLGLIMVLYKFKDYK